VSIADKRNEIPIFGEADMSYDQSVITLFPSETHLSVKLDVIVREKGGFSTRAKGYHCQVTLQKIQLGHSTLSSLTLNFLHLSQKQNLSFAILLSPHPFFFSSSRQSTYLQCRRSDYSPELCLAPAPGRYSQELDKHRECSLHRR
jgi:hypothetical protein